MFVTSLQHQDYKCDVCLPCHVMPSLCGIENMDKIIEFDDTWNECHSLHGIFTFIVLYILLSVVP